MVIILSTSPGTRMIFDLHTHTRHSDGELGPSALLARARANGVDCLAITDHDTVAAFSDPTLTIPDNLLLMPGIEFSARWRKRGVHVVGLNVDLEHDVLQAAISRQARARKERAEAIAGRLDRLGIDGSLESVEEMAAGGTIGRPHFARFLVEQGHVKDVKQAFAKFLGAGKPGDVKNVWPDISEVVQWILDAGGVPVLAHPAKYKLTRTKLRELTADFKGAGGKSIEVVCGKQTPDVTAKLAELAGDADLLASCGSDFHRVDMSWSDTGRFPPLPTNCRPVWDAWQ